MSADAANLPSDHPSITLHPSRIDDRTVAHSLPASPPSTSLELHFPVLPLTARPPSRIMAGIREHRGSDANSDYTHSSLADSNYSLISGDEAAIISDYDDYDDDDEEHSNTHEMVAVNVNGDLEDTRAVLDSVVSLDEDSAGSQMDQHDHEEEHRKSILSFAGSAGASEVDEVDETLLATEHPHGESSMNIEPPSASAVPSTILQESIAAAYKMLDSPSVHQSTTMKPLKMAPKFLKVHSPYKILYHGPRDDRVHEIMEKIAQAVAVSTQATSSSTASEKDSFRYNVVALSGFGADGSAPDIALIPSKGIELNIKVQASGEKSKPYGFLPDLEVFLHDTPETSSDSENDRPAGNSVFKSAAPELHITQYEGSTLLESTEGSAALNFYQFMLTDAAELNRHLAHLTTSSSRTARSVSILKCHGQLLRQALAPATKKMSEVWAWCTNERLSLNIRLAHILMVSIMTSLIMGFFGLPLHSYLQHRQDMAGRAATENMEFRVMPRPGSLGAHLPAVHFNGSNVLASVELSELPASWTGLWMDSHDKSASNKVSKMLRPGETDFVKFYKGSDGDLYLSLAKVVIDRDQAPAVWIFPSRLGAMWSFSRMNQTILRLDIDQRPRNIRLGIRVACIIDGLVVSGNHYYIHPSENVFEKSWPRLLPGPAELHKAVGKELVALHNGVKSLAINTYHNVEKGLSKLTDESRSLGKYSSRNLASRQSAIKKQRIQIKKATRQLSRKLRTINRQAEGVVQETTLRISKALQVFTPQVAELRSATVAATTKKSAVNKKPWYKSKALGKARAEARKLINTAVGKDVFEVNRDINKDES